MLCGLFVGWLLDWSACLCVVVSMLRLGFVSLFVGLRCAFCVVGWLVGCSVLCLCVEVLALCV